MIVTCDADRWEYVGLLMRADAPCGRTFDDVTQSTQCPHDRIGEAGMVCKESDLYKPLSLHCKRLEGGGGDAPGAVVGT